MVAGAKPTRRLKEDAVPSAFSYSHYAPSVNAEVCAAKRRKTVKKLEVGRVCLTFKAHTGRCN